MYAADVSSEARGVGVFRDGDKDLDVVGGGSALELRSCLRFVGVSACKSDTNLIYL